MPTNNDLLFDANAQHQLFVVQFTETEAKKAARVISEARDEIQRQLGTIDSLSTKKQLRELNSKLQRRLLQIFERWPSLIKDGQREFIKEEYRFQEKTVSRLVRDETVKVPPQKETLKKIRTTPMSVGTAGAAVTINEMLNDFPRDETKRVISRVTAGFFNSEPPREIARAITGLKKNGYRDGMLNISKRRAEAISRTTYSHLQHQAKEAFLNENDDLIDGVEIVATLDSRTSAICKSLDGQVFKKGKGPRPPFHYNCRTTYTYVLKKQFRVNTKAQRSSVDGPVSAKKTYYSWLKQQPASFQNEALGVQKARIFRNAGLSPEEFRKVSVKGFLKPRSIAEMARENDKIAQYVEDNL